MLRRPFADQLQVIEPAGRSKAPPRILFGMGLSFVLAYSCAIIVGTTLTWITGHLSPEFFEPRRQTHMMGPLPMSPLYIATHDGFDMAAQHGVVQALLVALAVTIRFRGQASVMGIARVLIVLMIAALAAWTIGGVVGVVLALNYPVLFEHYFAVTSQVVQMRAGWAMGSLFGLEYGSYVTLLLVLTLFRAMPFRQESSR